MARGLYGNVSTELEEGAALADAGANPTTARAGACQLKYNGSTWDRSRKPAKYKDLNAVDIHAAAAVWTPGTGKIVRLMGMTISVSAAGSVLLTDSAAGTVFRTPKLLADTPYSIDLGDGIALSAADAILNAVNSAGSGTVTGTLYGQEN